MTEQKRISLVWPDTKYLPGYTSALERGWSPDNRREGAAAEQLALIRQDPDEFLSAQVDLEGKGSPIMLPDGSSVPRLPGYYRWIWDGEFCGIMGFRWQPGTTELPSYCPGHIGYSIVPWKRGRGYATLALRMFLVEIRKSRLPFVEVVTDPSNIASRRVIEANGGRLVEGRTPPLVDGGEDGLRYRIYLDGGAAMPEESMPALAAKSRR